MTPPVLVRRATFKLRPHECTFEGYEGPKIYGGPPVVRARRIMVSPLAKIELSGEQIGYCRMPSDAIIPPIPRPRPTCSVMKLEDVTRGKVKILSKRNIAKVAPGIRP